VVLKVRLRLTLLCAAVLMGACESKRAPVSEAVPSATPLDGVGSASAPVASASSTGELPDPSRCRELCKRTAPLACGGTMDDCWNACIAFVGLEACIAENGAYIECAAGEPAEHFGCVTDRPWAALDGKYCSAELAKSDQCVRVLAASRK
jgi:hypothetical protein